MIRTRDLLLFLVCAAFLLIGIGVTGLSHIFTSPLQPEAIQFTEETYTFDEAQTTPGALDRQQRLLELQEKIASRGTVISEPSTTFGTDVVIAGATSSESANETEADTTNNVVQYCDTVTTVTRSWPAIEIVQVEREGRRLYLTEVSEVVTTVVGTTTRTETVVTENIFVHLPLRSSSGQTACIGQDVIGIAQDGSLLRNDNHVAYGIFSSETLIGYALDGLPIYGQTNAIMTDACGGATINGQYRYYLSADRPGMIGCFAATPVQL